MPQQFSKVYFWGQVYSWVTSEKWLAKNCVCVCVCAYKLVRETSTNNLSIPVATLRVNKLLSLMIGLCVYLVSSLPATTTMLWQRSTSRSSCRCSSTRMCSNRTTCRSICFVRLMRHVSGPSYSIWWWVKSSVCKYITTSSLYVNKNWCYMVLIYKFQTNLARWCNGYGVTLAGSNPSRFTIK